MNLHTPASKLDQALGKMLDATTGRIKIVNDGFDDKTEALQKAIDRQNEFFDQQEKKLNDQFIALVDPAPKGAINGNISFDSLSNPVSVNVKA